MRKYPRFRLEIAALRGDTILFNVYDSVEDFKVVGFAAYNFKNELFSTNVRVNSSPMSELKQHVTEVACEIAGIL